jgi:hypothetical protein
LAEAFCETQTQQQKYLVPRLLTHQQIANPHPVSDVPAGAVFFFFLFASEFPQETGAR